MKQYVTLISLVLILLNGCKSDSDSDTTPGGNALGSWDQTVNIVGNPIAVTVLTFSGSESGGTFINADGNGGNWTLDGDSIRFQYVPPANTNLISNFTGAVGTTFIQMTGYANGEFNNNPFHGTWTATRLFLALE